MSLTPVEVVVQCVLKASHLRDLTVQDPPMEEIVQAIYAGAENGELCPVTAGRAS